MAVTFTIVVSTHNRHGLLSRCLSHLSCLGTPAEDSEVLVMDNGSDPRTRRVVEGFAGRIKRLGYHAVPMPGLHACRNAGYELSTGKILCYLDDDVFVESEWLVGVADGFSKPAAVLVGGPIIPEFEVKPSDWLEGMWTRNRYGKYLAHFTLLDFGETACHIPPRFVWGCNFSIRKPVLAESGGFHPDSLPRSLIKYRGDGESSVTRFVEAKGQTAYYVPRAKVFHWVSRDRMDSAYLIQRAFDQGVSDSYSQLRKRGGVVTLSLLYYLYARTRERLNRMKRRPVPETAGIAAQLKRSYWRGFRFHIRESINDHRLREWVCRQDYFGERGAVPTGETT